jgi:hypothetical protein
MRRIALYITILALLTSTGARPIVAHLLATDA